MDFSLKTEVGGDFVLRVMLVRMGEKIDHL
jgi:hypothetical protein